jgi:hypothetical protein
MYDWLKKFPGHPAMIVLTIVMTACTGIIVLTHMALGNTMPTGYDGWYVFLGGLAGVNVAGLAVNRTTDYQYQMIKNAAQPSTVSTGGPTTVEVKPSV